MAHMHATEIGRDLPPPIDVAPNAIAEISATLLRAQSFTAANGVALLVREGAHLVCRATNGAAAPEFGARILVEGTFAGLCLSSKRPQKCDDTETDPRVENSAFSRVKSKSILVVPVRLGSDAIAVLAVFSTSAAAFTNTHIAIVRTMADPLARHVQALPVLEPPSPPSVAEVPVDEVLVNVVVEPAAPPAPPEPIAAPVPAATVPAATVPEPPPPEPVSVAAEPMEPPPPPASGAWQLTPTPVKKDDELLVLAADPMPRPQVAAPRVFTSPRAYNVPLTLPLTRRRRRRAARIRIAVVAALVLASAILAAGWKMTRNPGPPRVVSAASSVPAIPKSQVAAAQPATPAPVPPAPAPVEHVTEPVAAPAAVAVHETKPPANAATEAKIPEKPAVIERATPAPLKLAAIPTPRPAAPHAADLEAPQIAMNAAPALPVIAAPVAAPALRQSEPVSAKLLQRVAPTYPSTALRLHITGQVVLSAVVRKDGSIGDVKVISGNGILRNSAINAVKQWRYSPAMLDGSPVESSAEIVLNFNAPR